MRFILQNQKQPSEVFYNTFYILMIIRFVRLIFSVWTTWINFLKVIASYFTFIYTCFLFTQKTCAEKTTAKSSKSLKLVTSLRYIRFKIDLVWSCHFYPEWRQAINSLIFLRSAAHDKQKRPAVFYHSKN